jgi:hypothetical protein
MTRLNSLRAVRLCLCVTALVCAALPGALAQEQTLEPADEAAQDASWVEFRQRLIAALGNRDRDFVLGILDRDVRAGLPPSSGVAAFQAHWHIDAEDSPLWGELARALALGAAFVEREHGERELCAPYVLARWPRDVDPFSHGAIVGRAVAVRSGPAADAPAWTALSYHVVAVSDWEVADRDTSATQRWVRIRIAGNEGYVTEEAIRTPIEHAACFVETVNGWRLKGLAPAGG